ncbi:hypothetical protein EDB81DRAFT_782735 [Dactylonectria macrodidyma]|uniref:Uncharacterized protein n=1 Tax=Dactylonectria macrodidyma TaxID=307937 RepID=A0A9P9FF54_9HYPO|nr:hypothetical protein EDB81DRAFT_782735 [Dactylonectria macrodidyma]
MATSRPSFSPWHIPPLFIATAFTFGGLLPFWNPSRAIREYGLPDRIATSRDAHTCFAIYGSRTSIFGVALWTFYLRGDFKALDTLMGLLVGAGAFDGYLCWKEGVPGRGLFRFLSSVVVGGWGLLGLSSRG